MVLFTLFLDITQIKICFYNSFNYKQNVLFCETELTSEILTISSSADTIYTTVIKS